MLKPMLTFVIATGIVLSACVNNSQRPGTSGDKVPDTANADAPPPDAADLLAVLQGKWQNETDSTDVLEIADTKMHHFNNGKFSFASDIEIDGKGKSIPCQVDTLDTQNGWCFVEKGQYDVQCNIVLRCDGKVLQYRALGAADGLLRFKKI